MIKNFLAIFAALAILLDIFAIAFGISYHYATQSEDVNGNSYLIQKTYALAQENHHEIIRIKHIRENLSKPGEVSKYCLD